MQLLEQHGKNVRITDVQLVTPPSIKVTEVIGFTVMSVCVRKGNRFR